MDDRQRLLRLISFVAWAGEPGSNQCGLRFARGDDEQQWYGPGRAWAAAVERGESASRPEGNRFHAALWRLTSWYAGAVWSGNDPTSRDLDTRQLPGITLEALEGLPDDVSPCWAAAPGDPPLVWQAIEDRPRLAGISPRSNRRWGSRTCLSPRTRGTPSNSTDRLPPPDEIVQPIAGALPALLLVLFAGLLAFAGLPWGAGGRAYTLAYADRLIDLAGVLVGRHRNSPQARRSRRALTL